jgi:hypothetical protein
MNKQKIVLLILIVVILLGTGWVFKLNNAHSSFSNYYKFRGCQELIEKTENYGICKTSKGDTIKIVLINGKWYLEGDGPGVW